MFAIPKINSVRLSFFVRSLYIRARPAFVRLSACVRMVAIMCKTCFLASFCMCEDGCYHAIHALIFTWISPLVSSECFHACSFCVWVGMWVCECACAYA